MDEQSLFLQALGKTAGDERSAWLEKACGSDGALRERIARRLQEHEEAGSSHEKPARGMEPTILPDASEDRTASSGAGQTAELPVNETVVVSDANPSVLKMLGSLINEVPRVALRAPEADGAGPIERLNSPEIPNQPPDSRYRFDGEIARGGMGAIIKGRDTDLGRDLAIKVLLDSHKDNPAVIQRFVEEAQIGGQLQHPGIAPIYELGQFADKRPFFAMKLVKGLTLSKLLADREDPTQDRGKFIGIFEQVCQTMAYAHSRSVIHRDLKPANIMVGAFGEVQVMDWGLAKVLPAGGVADEKRARNQSQAQSIIQTLRSGVGSDTSSFGSTGSVTQMGSVMGTPAYMPPEQALGEIDQMDERADVFGLGAILCEILTGVPPYVGENGALIFRMACRGKLKDCLARLDGCEADAELISLAKHCLEIERADRPRDAAKLAERVTGHLESVENKLRTSEIERAAQEARAEAESHKAQAETARAEAESARAQAETKRSRTSLALAASVVLLVGLGSGGWMYMGRQEASRLADEALAQSKHAAEMELLAEQRDAQRRAAESAEREALAAAEEVKNSLYHSILSDARATRLLRSEGYRDHVFERLSVAKNLNTHDQDLQQLRQEAIACLGDFVGKPPIAHTDLPFVIRRLAFHPNGVEAAITVDDGSIRIVDVETAQELHQLKFSSPLFHVWYSPSGQELIATSPASGTVVVFAKEAGNGWKERNRCSYNGKSRPIAYEAGRIAFLASSNTVQIHDVADGETISSLEVDHAPRTMGLSADGRQLIVGTSEWSAGKDYLQLWDVESGQLIAETESALGIGYAIAVSSNGKFVGIGGDNGMAVHELPSLQRRFNVQVEPVLTIDISPDNQFVVFGTRQKQVQLWSINTSREVASFQCLDQSNPLSIEFDGNGRTFAVASSGSLRKWNLNSADERIVAGGHNGGIPGVAFSPDGTTVASCGKDRAVKVWDSGSGKLRHTLKGFDSAVQTLAFHPLSSTIMTGEYTTGALRFWDVPSQRTFATLETRNSQIWKAVFTADGNYLAAIGGSGLEIWRVSHHPSAALDDRLEFELVASPDCIGRDVCFSPDGKLAAFNDGYLIRIWDLAANRELPFVSAPLLDGINSIQFLPDSRHIIFITATGGIQGWDVVASQRSFVIGKADDFAQGYSAITQNGRLFSSVKPPGIVTIWDVENRQQWFELPATESGVWAMAWSPNGRSLAVSRSDGSLSIWRLPKIRAALQSIDLDWTFEQPKQAADNLAFSPSSENQPSETEFFHWQLRKTQLLVTRAALRSTKEMDAAIEVLQKAIQLNTKDEFSRVSLGNLLRKRGKLEEANAVYQEAIDLNPDNPALRNRIAWYLVTEVDPNGEYSLGDQAVRWARQVSQSMPDEPSPLNTLGVALYRTEQWEEAIETLRKSTELGADVPHNWLFLSMAHWHLGNQDEARAWYEQSLEWLTDNTPDHELGRFFAEAAALLEEATPASE